MASSLLNKLKLIAGESIDTIDPTNPDDPNQAIINRYKNVPGVNLEKLTEYVDLNIPEPQTIVDAMLLAEAVGYTPEQAKVVGAQWVLESGRGVSTAGADYNYFGVKSHNKAVMKRMSEKYGIDVTKGATVNTGENAADGSNYTENVSFASFKNPIEGFLGKKAFLETNSNYKKALNPENTADQFAQGLQDAGYATVSDDKGNLIYKKKLAEIYNGKMRTTRPEWMKPTRKSNVPQTEWTMTGVQPTEGSRAGLVAEAITEETLAPEKIDLQSAEEMQAAIDVNALQEWNNLQKQNWTGVKEWDPKGVEMLKEYNKKMGVNYDPSEAWSAITISNAVMAGSGANNRDEIRAKGFNPSKGHSYYISDAFKTSKDPNYKYNKYKAEKLSGEYNIGDILVKGRKPKKGIDTSKWSYEDFKSHGPGYSSHTDIIVDKGTDDKGEYIEIAGGNVGDTYATEKIYVKDIPSKKYKATLRDKAAIKPSFSITSVPEGVDEVLAGIKYKPQVPKMPFGTSQEDVQNYLAEKQAYEQRALDQDLSVEELGAQELAAYEATPRSFDTFENMAQNTPLAQSTTASGNFENTMTDEEYDALGIKKPFSEPQIFKQNVDLPEVSVGRSKKEEIIPLVETEVDENKYDNLEFLNTLHQPRSIISEGSFTNEARSKEQLKRDAAAEKFISDPLQQSAKSGYFGSGQSMFYPSRQNQRRSGGSLAPIIPEYYKSKGTPIYRDTTSLPFNYGGILENGGSEDGEIGKPTNPINTSKGLFGMLGDAAKYSAARKMSKTKLPEQGDLPDSEYLSTLNRKELSSIPFKKQMADRDVKSEKYFVEGVQKRMSDIGLERSQYNTPMKEDYDYLGVPFMYNKDSWFHNLKGNRYADPYSCQGIACAIGRKAGAVNAQDYKTRSARGKANKPWAIETGSLTVDHADVLAGKGLYPVEKIQPGDMVRHGYKSPYGTGHNVIATGKSYISHNDEIEFPAAYASEWEGGVKGSSNYYFDPKTDQAFRYLRNLPRLEKEAVAAKSMYEKYQDYLDKKTIAKLPIKEAELIRTGPTKMPFIERKQYPNTRRGRKQEQQDNAYIEAYMARMQKK